MRVSEKNQFGVFQVLGSSFILYCKGFLRVLPFALLVPLLNNFFQFGIIEGGFKIHLVLKIVLAVLSFIVGLYSTCIVYSQIHSLLLKEQKSLAKVFTAVLSRFAQLIGALLSSAVLLLLLACVILVVSGVIVAIPGVAAVVLFSASHKAVLDLSMVGFMVLSFGLLTVCYIFFYVAYCFIIPLILFTKVGPIAAIKNSIILVWGRWWRTFWTILLALLVPGILVISCHVLQYVLHFSIHSLVISTTIVAGIFLPWIVAVVLTLYQDLRTT